MDYIYTGLHFGEVGSDFTDREVLRTRASIETVVSNSAYIRYMLGLLILWSPSTVPTVDTFSRFFADPSFHFIGLSLMYDSHPNTLSGDTQSLLCR